MAESRVYLPLAEDRNEIRLLTVHPSENRKASIICDIQVVSLDDDPVFDALSWCWGTVVDGPAISVCDYSLPCNPNLNSALRHLRDREIPLLLWVDAICIRQDDLQEKSSQISLMSRIYSLAQTVRIWLGEAADDSTEAIKVIAKLQIQPDIIELKLDGQKVSAKQWRAFTSLLQRPWFNRMWVVQELALSRQAIFYCGFDHFSWTDGGNLLRAIGDNLTENTTGPLKLDDGESPPISSKDISDAIQKLGPFYQIFEMIRDGRQHDIRQNLSTLVALSSLNATDPRDKVYGCLGLLPDYEKLLRTTVDYSLPIEAVYVLATYFLLHQGQCFAPFCYTLPKPEVTQLQLPSWSLDFSRNCVKDRSLFYNFSAAGEWGSCTAPRLEYPLLWIRGTFFDEIVSIHHIVPDIKAHDGKLHNVSRQRFLHTRWRSFFGLDLDQTAHEAYVGGGSMENAYWRTVICDLCTYNDFRTTSRIKLRDINAFANWIRNPDSHDVYPWHLDWQQNRTAQTYLWATTSSTLTKNAYLFHTKRGYIGMSVGPTDIQVGDHLYFIDRGEVPFALSPIHDDDPKPIFELASECYIHGIMDGEAFKKLPLPDSKMFRQHALRRQLFGGQPLETNFSIGDWQDIALK